MNKKKIICLVIEILNEELNIKVEMNEIDETLQSLNIDSLSFMMLIVYLENALSIEIDTTKIFDEDYLNLTLNTIIEYIYNLI